MIGNTINLPAIKEYIQANLFLTMESVSTKISCRSLNRSLPYHNCLLSRNPGIMIVDGSSFRQAILFYVYTMFPAAPAVPFARNVACRGILVKYLELCFQDLLRLVKFSNVALRYPQQAVVVISRYVTEALR